MVDWAVASDRQALATAILEVMTTDIRPLLGST
jgi:pimeloyl-[acyl-carrier protein] methyl ester esterase